MFYQYRVIICLFSLIYFNQSAIAQVQRMDMDHLPSHEDPRSRLYTCKAAGKPPIELDFKNNSYRIADQLGRLNEGDFYFVLTTKLGYQMTFDFGFTFEINYNAPPNQFLGTYTVSKGEATTRPASILCIRKY